MAFGLGRKEINDTANQQGPPGGHQDFQINRGFFQIFKIEFTDPPEKVTEKFDQKLNADRAETTEQTDNNGDNHHKHMFGRTELGHRLVEQGGDLTVAAKHQFFRSALKVTRNFRTAACRSASRPVSKPRASAS